MAHRCWGRRTSWVGMFCAFWLLAGARPAAAQVLELSGGSSSLFNAHGGSVGFRGRNYAGRFDVGLFGKPRFGYFFTTPFRGHNWGFGDQAIPFVLRSEEHTSELQSQFHLVCRLLLEKKKMRSVISTMP